MKRVSVVVEGPGDVLSTPHLVNGVGRLVGLTFMTYEPIKAKEWPGLKAVGQLERFLDLALSRRPDQIVVLVDLDDDCPVKEHGIAQQRIDAWKNGRLIDVAVCFAHREYEGWFLSCADDLFNEPFVENAESIRDAKGTVKRMAGGRYKEREHQPDLTKRLNLSTLYNRSRSFRHLVKEMTKLSYEELDARVSVE